MRTRQELNNARCVAMDAHATLPTLAAIAITLLGKKHTSWEVSRIIGRPLDAPVETPHRRRLVEWLTRQAEVKIFDTFGPAEAVQAVRRGGIVVATLKQVGDNANGVLLCEGEHDPNQKLAMYEPSIRTDMPDWFYLRPQHAV